MNHKRGRPKSKRAGCLLCKPHKHEAVARAPRSPAALAVVTERPQRERLAGSWFIDEWARFDGGLVVDLGGYLREADYLFDDDWDDSPQPPPFVATPLRVTLAEVAA